MSKPCWCDLIVDAGTPRVLDPKFVPYNHRLQKQQDGHCTVHILLLPYDQPKHGDILQSPRPTYEA